MRKYNCKNPWQTRNFLRFAQFLIIKLNSLANTLVKTQEYKIMLILLIMGLSSISEKPYSWEGTHYN